MKSSSKTDLIVVFDVLRGMPPRLRRYLRDYPAQPTAPRPTPPSDGDFLFLIDAGFLASRDAPLHLTPLGLLAREEIWAAEQYVARMCLQYSV